MLTWPKVGYYKIDSGERRGEREKRVRSEMAGPEACTGWPHRGPAGKGPGESAGRRERPCRCGRDGREHCRPAGLGWGPRGAVSEWRPTRLGAAGGLR